MDNQTQKDILQALLEQNVPSTTWSIDPLGDVWMINIVTGRAEIITHLCEMDHEQQAQFTHQIIDSTLAAKTMCHNTSSSNKK